LFYCPDASASSESVSLSGEEHHHFARALRCKTGDTLFVTNGLGLILECRAATVARSVTTALVVSVVEDRRAGRELALALGTIKKDKFEQAFEQCVELGITRCIPFVSENSHLKAYSQGFLTRLHKIAVSSIKQSFRSVLPHIGESVDFEALVDLARRVPRVVVGRQGAPAAKRLGDEETLVVVGPEAGFTGDEYNALAGVGAGFAGVTGHRLRSETAAVALIAALAPGD
jgi:16S rRNA (uracil1498-N3)-methyltransferase